MQRFEPNAADVEQSVRASTVFDPIAVSARDELVAAFEGLRLETGEVLIEEGASADALYLVRHGRLRTAVTGSDGSQVEVGQIGKNEVVGEMALITDELRSATVTAMRDTELFRLPADAFLRFTQGHPDVLRPFASVVVRRLRTALTTVRKPSLPATIVLVPTPAVDVEALAQAIAAHIGPYSSAVLASDDAAGRDNLAAWLLDIENDVDVSLLIADDGPTRWTRQCLRHADRVLLVTRQGRPAAMTAVEADPESAARLAELPIELVMQYETRPSSSAWLVHRSVEAHHNLREGSVDDIRRLVRRLTGDATVLVLGGGGARGFAHFGVIEAFREAGVGVDALVGTSAGALVGGAWARYGDVREIQDEFLDWFDAVKWRRDFTPPALALTTGKFMTEGFQYMYGDWHIEDLTMDYAAVSCDLVRSETVVHTSGPLWRAVRCSVAVPGLFPPVALGDRLLVDGGLVANLPVDVAAQRHPGARLIAVDVGDPGGFTAEGVDGSGITNGWKLRRQGNAGVTLPRMLMRLTELGQNDSSHLASMTIRPDVTGFGLTDTKPSREIIRRGYEAARRAIDDGLVDG